MILTIIITVDLQKREPMSDLIKREDAIGEIREVYEYEFPTASGEFDEFVTMIIPNLLRNLPSAEQEQKKGEWIEDETGYGFWTCSACGFVSEASGANILYHYCPNCGAKME